jgi:hypothetical protein
MGRSGAYITNPPKKGGKKKTLILTLGSPPKKGGKKTMVLTLGSPLEKGKKKKVLSVCPSRSRNPDRDLDRQTKKRINIVDI